MDRIDIREEVLIVCCKCVDKALRYYIAEEAEAFGGILFQPKSKSELISHTHRF
jgi:hypothetical protein